MRLFTLGELRLETDDGDVLSRRRKPLVLLTYLARHARGSARSELAALLWGERVELRARHSLRQALLELHRLLGDRLVISSDMVRLAARDLEVDATRFELDVEAGRHAAAVGRWGGDFLHGVDDRAESALRTWLESERSGLRRRLTVSFERLLDGAERRGERRESVAIARAWTQRAPLDESACRRLIDALRRDGRTIDALASHGAFVTRLREELDVVPSREFVRLADTLGAAARSDSARRGSGAQQAPSLLPCVGRGSALAALSAHWRRTGDGTSRLARLDSRPGMGARRLREEFTRWVRETSANVVVLAPARLSPSSASAPFAAARAMLDELAPSPALGGLGPESLADLAALLPEVRARFAHLPARDAFPSPHALATAVREALEAISEDGPVLVDVGRLDDVDPASRELMLAVAEAAHGPVLFLCTIDGDEEPASTMRVPGDRDAAITVPLAPLSLADVRTLLEHSSTLQGDDGEALARSLHHDTDGIPRYVAAAIEGLIDERLLVTADERSGRTISGLEHRAFTVPNAAQLGVQRDLARLDGTALRLVEGAAVLDAPAELREIASIADLSLDDAATAISATAVANVLAPVAGTHRFQIAPPMVQRAVYALIPPLRREALHARAVASMRRHSQWHRGLAPRARIAHHEARAGGGSRLRSRRRMLTLGSAMVALLSLAALAWYETRSPRREQGVAIFPFTVSGSARLHFLRAGMADLLSTSLDGAAGLHTIDPRAVIAATTLAAGNELLDVDRAREIASRLGASQFVLGTIVGGAGRLQASAALYGMRRGTGPLARVNAEGSEAALFDVVDRLTAQLAVAQGAGPHERLAQLAAVTTSSLEALKAYLQGRNAYRANDLYSALAAFQSAVEADSSFALAWYGLASTASWMLRPDIERAAAAQAVRQSGRLSSRDRMLIDGFAAYTRGAADTAEALATSVVQTYDDTDGWVLLGEVLFHHNWKRGRSLAESRTAWERVLALDPTYWPALQHLAEVASLEGRVSEADSLLAQYERSVGTPRAMLASRALRAFSLGDSLSRGSIATQLEHDRGFWLALSVWYVSVLGRNVEGARALARPFVDPLRPPEQQGFGWLLLAHLALAQGRWTEARAELSRASAFAPTEALEYQMLLSMAPFLSTSTADLRRVRDDLLRLPPAETDNASARFWPHTQAALHPIARRYLAGMVSARTGDDEGRARALADLATLPDPTGRVALATGFAFSIRAEHEHARGQSALALASLERGARATPFVAAWTSGFVSQPYERYLRAELLHALGRDDEALRWYGTFGENSPYDLVYLAPALYRQAQIHDRRGERALALSRYRRFMVLWKDCDPALRPLTDDAATRVARLQ
ncbi:MAG: hypothetical protein LH467_15050 [Gemmatimonadaceae bacterium]|nr:hypothetical protein [Gemmatimonadaceae bacterium]